LIIDEEDFLQHYGKKGMKWGTRSTGGSSRQRNKNLNKISRAKSKTERLKTVEKARVSVSKGGKSYNQLKRAKQSHSANKAKLGSHEARKILRKAKEKHYNEAVIAQQTKNGKETALLLTAGTVGALAVYGLGRILVSEGY
jgi:hypothetical protein